MLVALALSAAAKEPPGIDADIPLGIPHEEHTLDNGLRVVLAPDPSVPLVAVDVWYHAGSRDEVEGRTGFAHLFEHLMFQGSPSQPGEYFAPLERLGASINGSTDIDRTNYYEVVPAEALPLALFLEADRMGGLLDVLDQAKLDNQREVVRNERRQRVENRPYGDAGMRVAESLFPAGHGYHHPTIGSHADLEAASLEDVSAFFRRWYRPDNAVLAVVGGFDPVLAMSMIERWFGPIAADGAFEPSQPPSTPALDASIELRSYRDVPQRRVWLAWHTPAAGTDEDAAMDLLAAILAEDRDGRLVRELVERRKVAQEVWAVQSSSGWSSRFTVGATAAPGHTTDEVVSAIDEVLAELLGDEPSEPITEGELGAIAASYELSYRSGLATVLGRAEALQRCVATHGEPDCVERSLDRYRRATVASVTEAGRRWLRTHRVALHVLPEADRPAPPVAEENRRRGRAGRGR